MKGKLKLDILSRAIALYLMKIPPKFKNEQIARISVRDIRKIDLIKIEITQLV